METQKDFIIETEGGVITSSRMKVWWLTTFQGYEVRRVLSKPQQNPLGQVKYMNHWELDLPQITKTDD